MTLGGLALAVGILVDDATVAIENINQHLEQGKPLEHGDPGRRAADRGAGVRLDAVHLHRVRADVPADRRGAVPVRAAGRGGRVRDARLVLPLAHAGADAGEVPAARTRTMPTRTDADAARNLFVRLQRALRARLRAAARALSSAARALHAAARRVFSARVPGRLRGVAAAAPVRRPRFLPVGRRGPVQAARARADRHAHRGDGARCAICVETAIRESIPPGELEHDHRQHRPAVQRHQPLVQQLGHDRARRRRHPRLAQARAIARPTSTSHDLRQTPAARVSRRRRFSFLPADIVSQILNFGLPAPIDIQVVGRNIDGNRAVRAAACSTQLEAGRPGIADLRIQQPFDQPKLDINVDRTQGAAGRLLAARRGEQPADLAQSGSFQTDAELLAQPEESASATRSRRRRRSTRSIRCRSSGTSRSADATGAQARDPRQPGDDRRAAASRR